MKQKVAVNKKGVTLIELVISIAILAIIVIVFSAMFLSGTRTIAKSGQRSSTDYKTQEIIESQIQNPEINMDSVHTTIQKDVKLSVKFKINSATKEINIKGENIISNFSYNNSNVVFTTFVPDRAGD